MPFSVALQQPRFSPDDDGGLGDWSDILTGIADIAQSTAQVGTAYLLTQGRQAQTQVNALQQPIPAPAGTVWQTQLAPSFSSSPMFLPVVGGLGLLLLAVLMKGKR